MKHSLQRSLAVIIGALTTLCMSPALALTEVHELTSAQQSTVTNAGRAKAREGLEAKGTDAGTLKYVNAVAVDKRTGDLWVADSGNGRVVHLDPQGSVLGYVGGGSDGFGDPQDVAVDNYGGRCVLAVADSDKGVVRRFICNGEELPAISQGENEDLHNPQGVSFANDGSLLVTDASAHQVHKYDASGKWLQRVDDDSLQFPKDAVMDSEGTVWVSDFGNNRLVSFGSDGKKRKEIRSIGGLSIERPVGLDSDDIGRVWVALMDNNKVGVVDQKTGAGHVFGEKESGQQRMDQPIGERNPIGFDHPKGVAVSVLTNQLWIATPGSHSVRAIALDKVSGAGGDIE